MQRYGRPFLIFGFYKNAYYRKYDVLVIHGNSTLKVTSGRGKPVIAEIAVFFLRGPDHES